MTYHNDETADERVQRIIIEPMIRLYQPPRHLTAGAGDADQQDAMRYLLDTYRRALRRFTEPTLIKGWHHVTVQHKGWSWPQPSEIAEACSQHVQALHEVRPVDGSHLEPWEQKHRTAIRRARDAAEGFLATSPWRPSAEVEGWEGDLRAYVHELCRAQALAMAGLRAGYDAQTVLGFAAIEHEERKSQFWSWIHKAVRHNEFVIVLPDWLADECRLRAEGRLRRAA